MEKTKNKKQKIKNSAGFTLIEIIIACTIITITVFALMSTAQKGIALSNRSLKQVQANTLLEEGAEAVKTIRDNDWATIAGLTLNTDYYLFFDTNTNVWSLNTSMITPGGSIPDYPVDSTFNRSVVFSAVNRDSNDDITEIGILDDRTKKVTVTTSWNSSGSVVSKSLVFYLTDIFN